jgi:hypothetical protein
MVGFLFSKPTKENLQSKKQLRPHLREELVRLRYISTKGKKKFPPKE